MKKALIIPLLLGAVLLWAIPTWAQSTTGELRLTVTDPAGLAVKSTVELVSQGTEYSQTFTTNSQGKLDAKRLPYGIYQVQIVAQGFAAVSQPVEIRSALPLDRTIQLKVAAVSESVKVTSADTLMDPYRPGSVNELGSEQIQDRLTAIPGRGIQDLVNSQPGWLYEGNAVLHPRGSEYQTQFVVNGIPLTDNRSPSFGPEPAEAQNVQSLKIYTAGIPAEYGRKMGGVVEVNTLQNGTRGLHGQFTLFGGSYDTAAASTQAAMTANIALCGEACTTRTATGTDQSSAQATVRQGTNQRGSGGTWANTAIANGVASSANSHPGGTESFGCPLETDDTRLRSMIQSVHAPNAAT